MVGSDNRLGNIKGDKMIEVFAKTIDKFGDQQIDSWTFDTENEARDFTKQKQEQRELPNEYQRKMGVQGTKTYYYVGMDKLN